MEREKRKNAATAGPEKSEPGRFFVPPLDEWVYDERGRPSWIPSAGAWARVVDRAGVRLEHPQRAARPPKGGLRGTSRLFEREPKKLLYAAWFKDCGGGSYPELARALGYPLDGLKNAEAAAKKKAIDRVRAGRAYAAALEIWPWACWPAGEPPSAEWWNDARCSSWLRSWAAEAIGQSKLAQRDAVLRSIGDAQLALASKLERTRYFPLETKERLRTSLLGRLAGR